MALLLFFVHSLATESIAGRSSLGSKCCGRRLVVADEDAQQDEWSSMFSLCSNLLRRWYCTLGNCMTSGRVHGKE